MPGPLAAWRAGDLRSGAALAARVVAVTVLAIVAWWVSQLLGGVSASPDVAADGAISTGRLFNWHPVLMVLAFPVLMSEALLAYRAPLFAGAPRQPLCKVAHWVCHSLAVVCVAGGLSAVWRSHDLASPPIPNLYSPHSFLGLATVSLMAVQFGVGFISYLYPKTPLEHREALGPIHRFVGQATYCAGLAAAASGLQEKATFLQLVGKKAVYSSHIRAPALAAALLLPLALLVLSAYAPLAPAPAPAGGGGAGQGRQGGGAGLGDDEESLPLARD
ncbi:MAG: cytochrome b561 [Monoraphidium minutum]|nr:MAG: cytochrome b561 [Monoraphidium minutum]